MTLQQHSVPTPVSAKGRATRPMTGDEYIESLRDGREVYLYGEKVGDVTTHPAFRNAVRMTARLYDSMHDPAKADVLTTPTDTGSAGVTHPFFRTLYSVEDLRADRDAIAEWARMTYGFMGRSPDYKAAFLGHSSEATARQTTHQPHPIAWVSGAPTPNNINLREDS
jgi:4-hydroxyphenylacetate 3-monooxygenase